MKSEQELKFIQEFIQDNELNKLMDELCKLNHEFYKNRELNQSIITQINESIFQMAYKKYKYWNTLNQINNLVSQQKNESEKNLFEITSNVLFS